MSFKYNGQSQESKRVPVDIKPYDYGKLTNIDIPDCSFATQVTVRESRVELDKSHLNVATGRGAKFVADFKADKPFELTVNLFAENNAGVKTHAVSYDFSSLVDRGVKKVQVPKHSDKNSLYVYKFDIAVTPRGQS